MENEKSIFGLQLTNNLREELSTLIVWAKIIAVCGFISVGISIIEVVQHPTRISYEILTEVITLISSILLMLFASKINTTLKTDDTKHLASGFNKLTIYFIVNVVLLFVIILAIIGFVFLYNRFL